MTPFSAWILEVVSTLFIIVFLVSVVLLYKKTILLKNKKILLKEYKDAVDRSSIVSKTNAKGIITFVNDMFCEISGYSREELLGKPHNIVRHPDEKPEIYKELWHTIKELKKPWIGKIKNCKKDGSVYWVKTIINPIFDAQGNLLEYIAIRTDVTEQEKLKQYFEKQLHITSKDLTHAIKLAQEYELAIDESNIVNRIDLDYKYTYVNNKFSQITGYNREELIGQHHDIIKHPDTPKAIFDEIWKSLEKGKIWKGTIKNKTKSGAPYWVNVTFIPIKDENGKIIEHMAIKHNLTELFLLHNEIEDTQREVIYRMGEMGETRSQETGNHVKRVAQYSKDLALLYGLSKGEEDILFTASPMHDIGKVGIPDEILKKPGKLTDDEFIIMKTHSKLGYNVLKGSQRPALKAAAIVALEHHEKWDGSGYPKGLSGEEIHIYGRITAIADVFDALGSDRVYKKAWEDEKIIEFFKEQKEKHFDPKLVELLLNNLDIFWRTRDNHKD